MNTGKLHHKLWAVVQSATKCFTAAVEDGFICVPTLPICVPKMLREAQCRVAEPVWRGLPSHYNYSATEETRERQVTETRQTGGQADYR